MHFAGIALLIISFGFLSDSAGTVDYYSPDNVLKFAEYLYKERDYLRAAGEFQRYLFYSPQNADSTLYRIGLCYRQAGNTERAISFFQKVILEHPESQIRSDSYYQIAYSYLLSGQYDDSIGFLNQVLRGTKDADERGRFQILSAFGYMHQRRWRDAEQILKLDELPDESGNYRPGNYRSGNYRPGNYMPGNYSIALALRKSAQEGMSLPCKNPGLAGLFSTVMPGTGRIYCKQYGDGIYSFIVIAATGLLAWDGFRDNGVSSVRGWLLGSISGIFYAGNVYGSAISARVYNRQLEMELLNRLPPIPDN